MSFNLPIRTGTSAGLNGSGARADRHTDRENAGSVSAGPPDREPENVQRGPQAARVPSSAEPNTDKCDLAQENRERFIDQTLNIFQRRSPRSLAREDGRQIAENVTGFFKILMQWEAQSRQSKFGKIS